MRKNALLQLRDFKVRIGTQRTRVHLSVRKEGAVSPELALEGRPLGSSLKNNDLLSFFLCFVAGFVLPDPFFVISTKFQLDPSTG